MDSQDSPLNPIDPTVDAPLIQPPPPPPQPSQVQTVFFGPYGLRAGWKWLLFILAFSAFVFCFGFVATRFVARPAPHTQPGLKLMFIFEFIQASAVLLATGVMAKLVDKKLWGYFGLPLNRAFGSDFWLGAIIGFGALAIQLEVMHLCGWFDFGSIALHGAAIFRYGAYWGVFFLFTGFFEEGLLRGYPQRVLTNGIGFWPAAVLLSIIFASLHLGNGGENWFGIFMVFVDGMTMSFSLWRTGNMWFAVANHAAWDWSQTFFFGTPDSGMKPIGALFAPSFHGPALLSGGADGPEGSVLVILAEALIVVAIAVLYPKRKYPLLEDETAPSTAPAYTNDLGTQPSPTA